MYDAKLKKESINQTNKDYLVNPRRAVIPTRQRLEAVTPHNRSLTVWRKPIGWYLDVHLCSYQSRHRLEIVVPGFSATVVGGVCEGPTTVGPGL